MDEMKHLESRVKHLLNYLNPFSILKYRKLLQNSAEVSVVQDHTSDKKVIFRFSSDFWHGDMGRYAYLLVKAFAKAGYQIAFSPEFAFLSRLNKYKKLLLHENFQIIRSPLPEKDGLLLINHEKQVQLKIVHVNPGNKVVLSANTLLIPYMMHPSIYHKDRDRELGALRSASRIGKILFAGNVDPKAYDGGSVVRIHHKLPRYSLIRFLESALSAEEFWCIKSEEDFSLMQPYENKLLIIKSQDYKIPSEYWLPTLSNYDFFLACPGSDMPMCHNAVEAMAVGSIPLLEYAEYFHPALIHQQNCIIFKGKEDLLIKLREVLAMEKDDIEKLRANVIRYYDTYLEPSLWVEKVVETQHEVRELVFDAWKVPE